MKITGTLLYGFKTPRSRFRRSAPSRDKTFHTESQQSQPSSEIITGIIMLPDEGRTYKSRKACVPDEKPVFQTRLTPNPRLTLPVSIAPFSIPVSSHVSYRRTESAPARTGNWPMIPNWAAAIEAQKKMSTNDVAAVTCGKERIRN